MLRTVALLAALCFTPSTPASAARAEEPTEPPLHPVLAQRQSRLARHSLFSKLGLRRVERPGHVWYVQMRPGDEESRIDKAIRRLEPWAAKTESLWDEHVAVPAGFDELGERLPLATVVLASRGDYINYYQLQRMPCPVAAGGVYDPYIAITVTYDEGPSAPGEKRHARWGSRAHAWVHALHQAYSKQTERLGGPGWVEVGLAGYLVRPDALTLAELVPGSLVESHGEGLARAALNGGHADGHLLPLEDLLEQRDSLTMSAYVSTHARRAGGEYPRAYWTRIDTLDAQAALLVGDLLNPNSPYRAGFLAFLKRCMRGGGSEPQFREALGIDSLGVQALDFEYWSARLAWLHRLAPTFPLKCAESAPLIVRKAAASVAGDPSIAGAALGTDVRSALDVRRGSADDRLALALVRTASGDFEEAEALLAGDDGAEVEDERIGRELARVRAVSAEAAAELEARLASGDPIRLRVDGKYYKLELLRIEDGKVRVGKNRGGVVSVPLDGALRAALATEALKSATELDRRRLQAWFQAVRADQRARKSLGKLKDEGSAVVVADAEAAADLLARGAVLAAIDDLRRLGPEGAAADPERALQLVEALLADHATEPAVVERRDALEVYARDVLLGSWGPGTAVRALHPTRHLYDGELLELTYEFDDEAELRDFELVDDYHQGIASIAEGLTLDEAEWGATVEDGVLDVSGYQVLRHRLVFTGETEARIRFSHVETGEAYLVGMFLSIRNDGTGRTSLYCSEDHYLSYERDWRIVQTSGDETPQPSFPGVKKEFFLHHDGEAKTVLFQDGEVIQSIESMDVPPGSTVLVVTSDWTCRVESLVLRGVASYEDSHALRDAWVAEELARLGFTSD